MARLTICPHYLIDYNLTSPDDILKDIIMPLYICLNECVEKNVQLVLSSEILMAFEHSYPWAQTNDPSWAGHLRDWYQLISPSIQRADILEVGTGTAADTGNCSLVDTKTHDMFTRFLAVFGTSTMHSGLHEEGIFISVNCAYPVELQSFCYVINPNDDLIKVIY